jgi:hypothetical protein
MSFVCVILDMAEYGLLFLRRFLYEIFCCAFEGQSECLDEEILFGLSYANFGMRKLCRFDRNK